MKLPSLPLFTDTFSAETVHLSNEEVGIYIRLLCFAWTKKGRPFSIRSAYRIGQCIDDDCKGTVKKVLDEFFVMDGEDEHADCWTHKRITTEMNYLLDYYAKKSESGKRGVQAKRKFALSESQAPIPIPIPIPNNNFNVFWNNLSIKRGSKKNAERSYRKICQDKDPVELAKLYNLHASKIQDKQFVPHVVSWINGERFLDEDLKPRFQTEKEILPKGVPEGSKNCGSEGPYKTWRFPNGEVWNIHTFIDERIKIS